MSAKVISIINLKGGVGKSTLTMLLGEYLAFRHSRRVLLIDMDAQANLSYCMMHPDSVRRQHQEGRTSYHLFRDALHGKYSDVENFIAKPPLGVSNVARSSMSTYGTNIHMIVSTPNVAELDEELLTLWEKGESMPSDIREILKLYLEIARDRYEYVLIDCPPGLSLFSSAALIARDYYISPIIPEPLSLQGVDLVQARASQLQGNYDTQIEFKGTVLNIVKHYRNTHSSVAQDIYGRYGKRYQPFDYWVPDSEQLRKIGEYEPDILFSGQWAMGMDRKFPDLIAKYGTRHQLANPKSGPLDRSGNEGTRYRLQDRLANLVEEFQQRCM